MKRLVAVGAAALTLIAVGCGSSDEPTSAAGGNQEREITVFAASSLTAAFTQIGSDFEAANPPPHRDLQLRALRRPRRTDRV